MHDKTPRFVHDDDSAPGLPRWPSSCETPSPPGFLRVALRNGRSSCCPDNTPVYEGRFGNPQTGLRRGPIKGNVKRNISPSARCRPFFVSAFSPTCLNVHSRFESGLAQPEPLFSLPRLTPSNFSSSLCFHTLFPPA